MDEALRNRIIVILSVALAVFFFATISSCNSSLRQKAARDKEMAARLVLEEKMNKFSQATSGLEEKAKAREIEVQELKTKLATMEKDLIQNQLINQSLKEELEKVTKLKDNLESQLREAIAGQKKLRK